MMTLLSFLFRREPRERRAGIIAITADALLELLQLDGTKTLRFEGVPEDAQIETMWVDSASQTLNIVIESKELPIIMEGTMPPPIPVTVYIAEPAAFVEA